MLKPQNPFGKTAVAKLADDKMSKEYQEASATARKIYLSTKTKNDIDLRYRNADKEVRIPNNHDLGVAILSDKMNMCSRNVFDMAAKEMDDMRAHIKPDAKELTMLV